MADKWPGGVAVDGTRVVANVITKARSSAALEFRICLDTVEVTLAGRLCAVFHRVQVWNWLHLGVVTVSMDEVTLYAAYAGGQVSPLRIGLPGVSIWTIEPDLGQLLRERV